MTRMRKRPFVTTTKLNKTNSSSSSSTRGGNIKANTTEHNIWRDLTNQLFSSSNDGITTNNLPNFLHQGEECLKYWTKQTDINTCFEILDHLAVKLSSLSATAKIRHKKLHTEVKHGQMVWVTLDPNPSKSVDEWTAGAFDCIADAIDTEELDVFHYHRAIIDTNYKLWHDTNSEFYHDFMHYFNRVSGFNDEYFARKNIPFDNGHVNVSSFTVNYEEYDGFEDRGELSFPNLPPNQWYMVDLFPGFNFNLRGSAYRSDTVTPLGPNKVLIEFKGYGLRKDTPEERQTRIKHHNSIWGPFGRNLHEDLIGVAGQGTTMREGTETRNILHGRHENSTIHDEVGMRHYYGAWGDFLGVNPARPLEHLPDVHQAA